MIKYYTNRILFFKCFLEIQGRLKTKQGLLYIFLFLLLTSCLREQSDIKVRIGTNVWPGYELLYLARDKGFLAKDFTILEFDNATQVINGFKNGIIDVAAVTIDEAINLASTGFDLKILLICDSSNGADALIAQSYLENLKSIKGKKIGVENTALGGFFLSRILDIAGLQPDDVKIVYVPVDEHLNAYKESKFDAVVTFDPPKTEIVKLGGKELISSKSIPNEIVDVLVVRKSLYEEKVNLFSDLKKGWYRAFNFMNANKSEAYQLMAKREKLSVAEFAASINNLVIPSELENNELIGKRKVIPSLIKIHDYMLKKNLIIKPVKLESFF